MRGSFAIKPSFQSMLKAIYAATDTFVYLGRAMANNAIIDDEARVCISHTAVPFGRLEDIMWVRLVSPY